MAIRFQSALLLVFCCFVTDGQAKDFGRLTSSQGLSNSVTYGCVQDFRGFLWVATENGLNCYDGYKFSVYLHDPENVNSPSENNISVIIRAKDNNLWFGTWGGGLNKLDLKTGTFLSYRNKTDDPSTLSDDRVQTVFEDRRGRLWVGTYSHGLNCLDSGQGTFRRIVSDPRNSGSLSHNRIWSIAEAPDGTLWVGTGKGLNRIDLKTVRIDKFFHRPEDGASLPHDIVRKVFFDRQGRLWLGTENGLGLFDRENKRFRPILLPNIGDRQAVCVNTIFEDSQGNLWIGTNQHGLFRIDPKTFRIERYAHDPDHPNGLGHNDIRAISEDASHILWVCTRGGGLNKLDLKPDRFETIRLQHDSRTSLTDGTVRALFQDRQGKIWVGTENGLCVSENDGRTFTQYVHDPKETNSLSHNRVKAICQGRDNSIWIATWGGGVNRFDLSTKKFHTYAPEPGRTGSLSHDRVNALLVDRTGAVWIGTDDGLNRLAPNALDFHHYFHNDADPQSISSNYVTALFQDRSGVIWVGTENGLNALDTAKARFVSYRRQFADPHSLSHNRITCITQDPAGNLWVGTAGGLNRFLPSSGKFKRITSEQGLPSDQISGILVDGQCNLWISTSKGLTRYSPWRNEFRNYEADDGLQGNEFSIGAFLATADGRLWFGGTTGCTVFNPANVKDNPVPPPISLTSFALFDKEVLSGLELQSARSIEIPWDANFFSVEFSALDFTSPSKNRYSYMLEGFDKDWIRCGGRRFVSYTNLDGGEYILRVRGTNNDGVWNRQGIAVPVRVGTKPWKTWWAYTLYILVTLTGISLYVGFKTRTHRREIARQRQVVESLKRVDQLKDEFLENTSYELKSPVNGIIGIVESLLGGVTGSLNEPTATNLTMVACSARRLFFLVQDIIDFAKLRNHDIALHLKPVDLYQVVEVVLFLSRPLSQEKLVPVVNGVPKDLPVVRADENRLQQILFKLVENGIRHASEGSVIVSAIPTSQESGVMVSVSHTGQEIPAKMVREWNRFFAGESANSPINALGLNITHYLVQLHGGHLTVESEAEKVSTFRFFLPFRQDEDRECEDNAALPHVCTPQGMEPMQIVIPATDIPEDACRILVVDDETIHLQVVVNQLALKRFQVFSATNGLDAMELWERHPFDLVITDTVLPKLSGFELCRKIREKRSLFELPVIMMPERGQFREIIAGYEAGANDYLLKPFDGKELAARVDTLLSLRRAVQQAIENARQFESEKRQRELAETLRDLTRALSSTLNVGEVLAHLLESMSRIVPFDAGIAFQKDSSLKFRSLASRGNWFSADTSDLEALAPETIVDEITEKRNVVLIKDVSADSRFRQLKYNDQAVRSWIGMPIQYRGEVLGAVVLIRSSENAFHDGDADLVFTAAGQAGVALENSRMFSEIKRMAVTDSLSGLNNRRCFFDLGELEFQRCRRYGRPLSAIMADIDFFKKFNDTWGHASGDEVIRSVSRHLQNGIRKMDILGRFGGEEFSFILPETPLDAALIVAERLRGAVADNPVQLPAGTTVTVTISLGVSTLSSETGSLQALLDKADDALYSSKESGRNRVSFYPEAEE